MERTVILLPTIDQALSSRKHNALHDGAPFPPPVITTPDRWIEDLWEVWGSSRRIITGECRRTVMLHLLKAQDTLPQTAATAILVASFVKSYSGLSEVEKAICDHPLSLSRSEKAVLDLIESYFAEIVSRGFIEYGHALRYLESRVPHTAVHLKGDLATPLCFDRFLQQGDFVIVRDEPAPALIRPLPADVEAGFLFPSGEAARFSLLEEEIESLVADMPEAEILLVCTDPFRSFERLNSFLDQNDIAAHCRGGKPFIESLFGRAYCSLNLFRRSETDSFDALADFLLSPYSGVEKSKAYHLITTMRADRARDREEWERSLRCCSPHYSYFEELFTEADASIVLGYFVDVIRDIFSHDPVRREEELAALSSLRSLYEGAREMNCGIEEVIPFVEDLRLVASRSAHLDAAAHVTFASFDRGGKEEPNSFDAVIVCDLDANSYPATRKHSALDLMAGKLGIDEVDTTLDDMRRSFIALQRCSRRVFVCEQVLNFPEGDQAYPAFFYEEYLSAMGAPVPSHQAGFMSVASSRGWHVLYRGEEHIASDLSDRSADHPHVLDIPMSGSIVDERFAHGSFTMDRDGQKDSPLLLSPSSIELYLTCPYRWFIERKLNPSAPDEEFGPLEQGTFVHDVFFRFHERFLAVDGNERVTEDNLSEAEECLAQVFDETLALQRTKTKDRYLPLTEMEKLDARRLKTQMLQSLEKQARLLPSFVPFAQEKEIGRDAHILYAGSNLVGRVDRVDVDRRFGKFVVIDYKGGVFDHEAGYRPDDDGFVLPHKVQALIYAQALRTLFPDWEPVGALYLSYRASEDKGSLAGSVLEGEEGIASFVRPSSYVDMNFSAYLDKVEQALVPYVQKLREGMIAPHPRDSHACEYCVVRHCPRRCV